MNWPFILVLTPTLCYSAAAVAYGVQRNWPNVVIFTGYAIANTGFLAIELMRAK